MKLLRQLTDALLPAPYTKGAGFLLGWYALVWGIVALAPGSLFATSPVYRLYPGPEWAWGAGFASAGAIQVIFARKGGGVAWAGALVLTALFAFTSYLFTLASVGSAAGYASILFCIFQFRYALGLGRSGHSGDT